MVIDFHTHCFPDSLARKALRQLSAAAGSLPFFTDGTAGGLTASMEKAGISYSVIQHIATKPAATPTVNRWAAEVNGGKIVSFGTIHPDYSNWRDEIAFLTDAGIKGIKFHPDYQDFVVDEKRLYPIYEAAAGAGLVMLFHAGLDLGYPPPYKCMPNRMANVVRDFPGARFVATHMGAYNYWREVEEHLVGTDVYFDTAYCSIGMERESLARLIRLHGAGKVLFGSDSPWTDQAAEAAVIRSLALDEPEKEAVLWKNAAKLLGIAP
jgi:predicted TIM-barrel fold metal-dependent hydrolase